MKAASRTRRSARGGRLRRSSRARAAGSRRRVGSRRSGPAKPAAGAYDQGFADGYREGVQSGLGSFSARFEGTSIVIPTYNQVDLLRQCIESIMENTDLPYEIIVIDNASSDGTEAYLRQLGGQVRYRVLDSNKGFSGAINLGMMMAKGETILLLNNDTVVTERWLDNMLACLGSDDRIGMVGPVTNYISGEQQIKVPYGDIREMHAFAKEFNKPDPAKWRRTDRLVGFCLLFRRSLFQQVGYFDEGFEIGNFEDDDFNIRVRLTGRSLVVAADTFIHHYGSVSMKALGNRFRQVNDKNEHYYMDKWPNPYESIHQVLQTLKERERLALDMTELFPDGVLVKGVGPALYWIEEGGRRPVDGAAALPVSQVSQVDLLRWPIREPISAAEMELRYYGQSASPTGFARLHDDTYYRLEGEVARKVSSRGAIRSWNLDHRPVRLIEPEVLAVCEEGLPIIAPPVLKQVL
ncbi:glycosyltransferase family 2 protein [Cohnella fermenti]|uniref:Glycosyltransferase family 2 protein n=1 Tax=Cohnella fermenti TaxID=2565925 RepID=A0A4S4BG34_9BACL|nr:glycosyltransferase family 2 protein [Cohnella fermenti]THF73357.1 glycosyltransferase family 2 protein [Cohnella fermenti]